MQIQGNPVLLKTLKPIMQYILFKEIAASPRTIGAFSIEFIYNNSPVSGKHKHSDRWGWLRQNQFPVLPFVRSSGKAWGSACLQKGLDFAVIDSVLFKYFLKTVLVPFNFEKLYLSCKYLSFPLL